jgi:hypothetical protein
VEPLLEAQDNGLCRDGGADGNIGNNDVVGTFPAIVNGGEKGGIEIVRSECHSLVRNEILRAEKSGMHREPLKERCAVEF